MVTSRICVTEYLAIFRNSAGFYIQRFPYLIGNTADQSKRGRTKMASKQLQNRKKTVSEHFSLSSGSDSSLVSLTNEPDFLGKRAVP